MIPLKYLQVQGTYLFGISEKSYLSVMQIVEVVLEFEFVINRLRRFMFFFYLTVVVEMGNGVF